MRSTFHPSTTAATEPLTEPEGRVLPMVSMLRRGSATAPGRRPPMGRRLRDASPDAALPTQSRIVFRAGAGLALR